MSLHAGAVPTADDFRALARSGPWRFTHAHFTRTGPHDGPCGVEAWLDRPGRMRVRDSHGEQTWVDGQQMGVPRALVAPTGLPEWYADGEVAPEPDPVRQWARDLTPRLRADGLLAERPTGTFPWSAYEADDPMYDNYRWVAMLDPLELSAGVELTDLREATHHGRPVWAARAAALEEYEPRCGCCALLWSEISDRGEYGDERDLSGIDYPLAWDVMLDVATAMVVRIVPVWASGPSTFNAHWFDVEIHSAG